MNLNKRSRAGKLGTIIKCPGCNAETTVYHMAWSAISCSRCRQTIDKYQWQKVCTVIQRENGEEPISMSEFFSIVSLLK